MALGRKTGGRQKGSLNKKSHLALAAVVTGSNPIEFLINVMQHGDIPLADRLRAASLALPFLHMKPSDAAPKVIEIVKYATDEGRARAMALTMKKFNGGLSDDEAAELAALKAEVVRQ
jgi:hypothetical protein